MSGRALPLAVFLVASLVAGAAEARPTIAVLEFRSNAKGALGLGQRFSQLLTKTVAADVIELEEARRRLGTKLDADVARCGTQLACISNLGNNLGASEVLLIGVSQLGDVVVSLQRIDTSRAELAGRLAESIAADAEPSDAELIGWLKRLYPAELFIRYGEITISANVDGAKVSLNGVDKGRTPLERGLRMRAPASYRLRVERGGFVPFEARVDLVPEARMEVKATLVRTEGQTPWFKRWYVWATIGGAAVIAGGAVAIYFGTRVDNQPRGQLILPSP